MSIGCTRWAIAEGYLPDPGPHTDNPALCSHETACVLNAGDLEARLRITVYFAAREPAGPYRITVPPRRTLHMRFDDLRDPEPIPRNTDYASLIESDVPVVVQHTRMDARPQRFALITTVAHGAD